MKQMVCEMCGSTNLVKEDGVFVCQSCGTKHSVEEAKKMMVEGTVKVDNSDKINNYYKLARTAKNEDDSSTASKYYALILEEIPDSWEAKFYSLYYQATSCKVTEAYTLCVKLEKIASSVLDTIKNDEPKEDQTKYVVEIADKMYELSDIFENGNSADASQEAPNLFLVWGDQLEEKFPENSAITSKAAMFWEKLVANIIETEGTGKKEVDDKIAELVVKIKKYNSDYEPPKSKLTYHTSSSPNKLYVGIVKVGHETYQAPKYGYEPIKVFADGPDSVGHIGVQIEYKNIAGKEIKYMDVYVTPQNSVGDDVCCRTTKISTTPIRVTGPLSSGSTRGGWCDGLWYNNSIVTAKIDHVDVTYNDDSIERYSADELSEKPDATEINNKLTDHTSNSPNKLYVGVVEVGHSTYEAPVFGFEPVKVFTNGPDTVGHIGAKIEIKNIAGKTINYIAVYLTPYNSVGDPVNCMVKKHSTYGINVTGPIAPGESWEGYADGMWYNNTIVSAKIDHVDVTYSDKSMERYTPSELSDVNTSTSSETNSAGSSGNAGGCYVATAVYGSYDCPQVWTLRRFRDDTLASTWYGRMFIHTYYAISPTLVKWFGRTEWFKKLWQGKLDKMIKKLQENGVEDTPYEDKNW